MSIVSHFELDNYVLQKVIIYNMHYMGIAKSKDIEVTITFLWSTKAITNCFLWGLIYIKFVSLL